MRSLRHARPLSRVSAALVALAASLLAGSARADDTIQHPGAHFSYFVEIEPHLDVAWGDWSGGLGGQAGYGLGARLAFPVMKNGFVSTINDSVAVGVGLDFLHFGCGGSLTGAAFSCSLNSLSLPVVMQWNFYVSPEWSVFGEPGLFLYHQFYSSSGSNCVGLGCPSVTETSLLPAFWVGARYRLNDRLYFTARIGYPTVTLGMSFVD